jgi:hypothetical protein
MIGVLMATAIKIANVEEGRTRLIDLITAAFMAKFGPAMRALQDAITRLAKQMEHLDQQRAAPAQLLLETPQWIPASKANHGRNQDEHVETKMRDWQRRHFWEAGLILFLIPFAAGASILTAQKNLMATGLPVFLDSPHLAWSMAALAPLSGFAVKTMIANIRNNRLRGLVTVLLYALTVVFVLLWVFLFAVHFSGLTPAPVTDGLFEEQTALNAGLATAFTMTTLVTEVLVMTVLASRLSAIADFYSPNPANVQAARDSFNGRGLTESQFREAWNIAGIVHSEIKTSGSFRDKLTDYAHAFARGERFDALRGEATLRDVYAGRYDQSMNQTREALIANEKALSTAAKNRALTAAENVAILIQEGPTRPFYQAYDASSVTLAQELNITQNAAKSLMKDAFQTTYGRDLYEHGKEIEEAYHKPVREAEIAAYKAEKLQNQSQSQSMG